MGEVSPQGVARALEALYKDPARRQELSRAAGGIARNPAYSWSAITRQFDDLIVELASGAARRQPQDLPEKN
jgi:glycosyltransferase involved in cell wall biosynthesis